MKKDCYIVERLSIGSWFFQIWPRLLGQKGSKVYVIDASPLVFALVRWLGKLSGLQMETLSFNNVDVKDESGLRIRLRIPFQDSLEIQNEVLAQPVLKGLSSLKGDEAHWPTYVGKCINTFGLVGAPTLLSKALFLIQLGAWQAKREPTLGSMTLFLNRRAWGDILLRYGKRCGVQLSWVWPGVSLDPRRLSWHWLKRLYYRLLYARWCVQQRQFHFFEADGDSGRSSGAAKIAVEYYGCFHLDKPAYYSDFFFWQQSDIPARDLLALFRIVGDPVDQDKWTMLQKNDLGFLVVDPRASRCGRAKPYLPDMKKIRVAKGEPRLKDLLIRGFERKWFKKIVRDYEWWYHYWKEIFKNQDAKIYVGWYKYDALHCPLGAALRDAGGLLALYQRALDLTPFVETQIHSDLYFAYSPLMAGIERKVKSKIDYLIVTGYLGDHRFSLLRGAAQKLRGQLGAAGARYIISFTDENSSDDSRWGTGHEFMRVNYAFLLEKLLQNRWLGLVLKPKVPLTLRRRLGEVRPLLEEALKTGRCFLYEEGPIQGTYPPAAAALSADIAVHGHLCGPTAAFEAALAGTPTVLLDREGWHVSPLYQLGEGKVVFKDWETLWAACMDRYRTQVKDHPVGCWGEMLNQLDPFRDGKAAYRMGTYLKWLIEGFKQGRRREDILTEAAHRYQKNWGQDKIISI